MRAMDATSFPLMLPMMLRNGSSHAYLHTPVSAAQSLALRTAPGKSQLQCAASYRLRKSPPYPNRCERRAWLNGHTPFRTNRP